MSFNITTEVIDDKTILHLDGRLDSSSSPQLEKKLNSLIDENCQKILLDFENVDFLTSAAMRVLHAATKKLKSKHHDTHSKHGHLVIYSLQGGPKGIIEMAGFHTILKIYNNQEEALKI